MSDVPADKIATDAEKRPPSSSQARIKALLEGPILQTLLGLAWPNAIAFSAGTLVAVAETYYIGRLGVDALAGLALIFPCVMLTMSMSGGAMAGGVASAIARALGADDRDRAATLATHALLIGISLGVVFMLGMLMFGPSLLKSLGGKGHALAQAVAYSHVYFGGAVIPWLLNTMAGILRGTGNMKLPSLMILNSAACQIVLGGVLGLGFGPVPQLGMHGVAAGTLIAYSINIAVIGWYLFTGRAGIVPKLRGLHVQSAMLLDILKVGAVACFSPLQSVLTTGVLTHLLAVFGTAALAAYGIGARLEYVLISIAFSVGVASVPMIGIAIGAERISRAKRIAWTAGFVAFIVIGLPTGLIAMLPDLWINIFTEDSIVRAIGREYLATVAPFYAFLGLGSSIYFSSQGAAKVLGPVLAQTARLLLIVLGGWWLSRQGAPVARFFDLAAVSMVVLGVWSSASIALSHWAKPKGCSENNTSRLHWLTRRRLG